MIVRPAKTQISLGICTIWSESSLCTQWVAKDPSFLHADSEDSDQSGQMPRLIWVFAGWTGHFVGFVMLWLNYVANLNLRAFLLCRNRFRFWPGFRNCPFVEWNFLETETGFLIYFAETETSFRNYRNHLQRQFRWFRLSEYRCSQKKMAASEWHMLLKLTINVHNDRE